MTTDTQAPPPSDDRLGLRDPYARIATLDADAVTAIADRIETRAADPRQQRLWRDALARLTYPPGARLLEVGSGTGVVTALMADLPGVAEVVGADPSPGLVERARVRAPGVRFDVADGRSLPYADAAFDAVVFACTLCHVPGPEKALAEARRVLVPGGRLLVYDGDYATTTVATSADDPLQRCADAAMAAIVHDRWLVRRVRGLVRQAGFSPGALHSHGHIEDDRPDYLLAVIDLGADILREDGAVGATEADALRAEARRRVAAGEFFGHIAYASLVAAKPG
jgi:ubiquinone/menaquinone biosynthesis C-methylase UbiE